jgi:hypothetical protein
MRVRKKVNGLRVFGQGQNSFWINSVDGVGQCITTRLGLWQGQWYLDLPDGTPYLAKILGKYTGSTADVAIQSRILGTPGVQSIVNYSSSLDRNTRVWNVNATVQTMFGQIIVTGYLPGPTPAAGIGYFQIAVSGIGIGALG